MAKKRQQLPIKLRPITNKNNLQLSFNVDLTGTKLTLQLLEKMIVFVKEGIPFTTSCSLCGISRSTHTAWMIWGRNYVEALEQNQEVEEDKKNHAVYYKLIDKAFAEYLYDVIKRLNSRFSMNWVRDITILERRDNENWGRVVNVSDMDIRDPDESFL
jgi:hypothetical protein